MNCLIIAEHDNLSLNAATGKVVTAAKQIGGEIHLLVAGQDCHTVATHAAQIEGVSKVWLADAPQYQTQSPEWLAHLIVTALAGYSHYLAAASVGGKALMPRLAALRDVAQISEIVAVVSPDTFVRPIYAGNALATVQSADPVKVITIRQTAFAAAGQGAPAPIEALPSATGEIRASTLVSRELNQYSRPELACAKVVISGGRGLGSGENFHKLLDPLADKLGAALGASRAAVDAGFVTNDLQIGQTGKIVAPQLYFAVGLSGAIQHVAGMKDSRVIVAINKDPEAPIFQVADYGLVADLFQALPALTEAIHPQ